MSQLLKQLFAFFDATPAAYWTCAALPTIALVGWIAVGVWRETRTPAKRSDLWFALLVLVTLFAWRWPYLLCATEFSSDESQQIAGAITLAHEPVFWRTVDAATAGPLDIYALLPVHLLGVPLDFFGARLTGLLLVWGTLIGCYGALRATASRAIARLGVLAGVLLFAVVTEGDLVYYTTEHVPICLIAVSFALLWRFRQSARKDAERRGFLVGGALVAGALPWAKLQSAPFAVLLGGFALFLAARTSATAAERARRVALIFVALLTPTVVGLAAAAVHGELGTLWRSYVVQNAFYVHIGLPWDVLLQLLGQHIRESSNLFAFLVTAIVVIGISTAFVVRRRRAPGALFVAGAVLSVTAVVVVLSPRRDFPHYFLFLIAPLTLWAGAAIATTIACAAESSRRRTALAMLAIVTLIPLTTRALQPHPFVIGQLLYQWRHPRSEISRAILRHAQPGDALAIWGWEPTLYVETGLPQAVRDGQVQRQVEGSEQQPYFRARFVDDLRRTQPALFVDATGPGHPPLADRDRFSHETYPELAQYVRENYAAAEEIDHVRIYVRRDRSTSARHDAAPPAASR